MNDVSPFSCVFYSRQTLQWSLCPGSWYYSQSTSTPYPSSHIWQSAALSYTPAHVWPVGVAFWQGVWHTPTCLRYSVKLIMPDACVLESGVRWRASMSTHWARIVRAGRMYGSCCTAWYWPGLSQCISRFTSNPERLDVLDCLLAVDAVTTSKRSGH